MSPRLLFALALSLALHGGLVLPDLVKRLAIAPPPPALQARLRPPPVAEARPAEPLLKNTIDREEAAPETKPAPPTATKPERMAPKTVAKREIKAAQRKLSQHLFYPPEAIARGLEGEVRLILRLSTDGAVEDVSVAASSGHAILDNAAVKAAYAMGALTGANSRELILPVIFRLQ